MTFWCGLIRSNMPRYVIMMSLFEWTRTSWSTMHKHFQFNTCSFLNNNQTNKSTLVHFSFAAMLFSKRCMWSCMVGLIRILKLCNVVYFKGHGPYEYQGYKGFKRPLQDPWRQRSNGLKVLTIFKGSRATGFSLWGSWLPRYNMSKSSKVSKALERQVSKVEGIQG